MILAWAGLEPVHAQDKTQAASKDEPKLGWSNSTDLSLILTGGNSDAATVGFSNQLRHARKNDRFEFDVSIVRTNKSDDRRIRRQSMRSTVLRRLRQSTLRVALARQPSSRL